MEQKPNSHPEPALSNDETPSKKTKQENIPGRVTPPPTGTPLLVPPSPPRYVSMEEIMRAAKGVKDMTLAHEIAVDNNFEIKKRVVPENSMEKQISDIYKKAFWDMLQEDLDEDPPNYSHTITLLEEVKGLLQGQLMSHQTRFRQYIEEHIDISMIKQKVENGVLDLQSYGDFVISVMERFCAPARDDEVAALKQIQEPVALFKEIYRLLDVMHTDMANFTITQMRPLIQKHSVDYERDKFKDFLEIQKENNIDGLLETKAWLTRSFTKFTAEDAAASSNSPSNSGPATSDPATSTRTEPFDKTPALVLNKAFMDLLDWDLKYTMAETLIMDQERFYILQERAKRLTLICSVLLITINTVGAALTGIKDFKDHLREKIMAILADVARSEVEGKMENVSDQVIIEVNNCLEKHGFTVLDEARTKLLRGQIHEVTSEDHMVHQLLKNRIIGFVHELVKNPKPHDLQLPPGVSAVSDDLGELCGQFLRLISHNRAVFGNYYVDIIQSLSGSPAADISPGTSPRPEQAS